MAAPKTVKTYPLAGTNRDFEIPFEYLARKFVIVTLIGTDRKELVLNVDYRFTQRTIITLTRVWGSEEGYNFIEIKRVTSATERLVDFSDGSILRASDLNTATVQALHIAEEGRDIATDTIGVDNNGQLDARGRQIKNLADGVDDGDAISMRQIRAYDTSALNSRNAAKVSETNAKVSETNAKASENAAAASQSSATASASTATQQATTSTQQATASRQSADRAADWAKKMDGPVSGSEYSSRWYSVESQNSAAASAASAASSLTQANRATTEADRAKAEADKLGNMNDLGAAIESVLGTSVTWKGIQVWKGDVSIFAPTGVASTFLRNANGQAWVRMQYNASNNIVDMMDYNSLTRWTSSAAGLFTVPSLAVSGAATITGNLAVNGGNIAVKESVQGGGAYMNFTTKNGPEGGLIWTYGSDSMNFRVGTGGRQWSLAPDGRWMANNATATAKDAIHYPSGNIQGSDYGPSGSVVQALRNLQRPRVVAETSALAVRRAGGAYIFDLPGDIWEYDEWLFDYSGVVSSLGQMIGFAGLPVGTAFYTASSPYYIQAKFIDTVANQRRVLHFTSFPSGHPGVVNLRGVKYNNVV